MTPKEIEKYKQAGKIAGNIRKFIRGYVKEGILLTEIAKTIQEKIEEAGAIAAFPPTLSIDDIAAHHHPAPDETTKASGIIKVDLGNPGGTFFGRRVLGEPTGHVWGNQPGRESAPGH